MRTFTLSIHSRSNSKSRDLISQTGPTLKKPFERKKPVVSDSFVSAAGNPVVVIAVPVLNKAGDITAVIGGGVHLTDLSRLVDKKRIGTFDLGFIVDKKGRLIAHTNTKLLQKEIRDRYIEHALVSKFLDKGPQDDSKVMIEDCVDPVDGKHYLTSFVRLKSGWGLGLALSRETILSEIRPAAWRITIIVSLIILLVGIIGAFFARWIGRRWIGTEEALREREKSHKEAQRVAHIGHWELYPEIGTPVWSDEIFRIFGLNPQESEPSFTDHETHLHPDDWSLLNNAVTLASTEGTSFDIAFRIVRSDGEVRWMHAIGTTRRDENGKVTKLFGTAQDITDRKRAEDALKENEEKYRSLITNIPDVTWTTDYEFNTIFVSPNAENVFGYTPEEIYEGVNNIFPEGIHPEDAGKVKEAFEKLFEHGTMFDVEYRIKRKDGEWIWGHNRSIAVYERDGVKYADGVFSNITSRKQAEEALRESEEKLARSNKMEAMGLMAGGVAHDLNNILSGIVSYPELLLLDLPEDSPLRKPIKTIQESGDAGRRCGGRPVDHSQGGDNQ